MESPVNITPICMCLDEGRACKHRLNCDTTVLTAVPLCQHEQLWKTQQQHHSEVYLMCTQLWRIGCWLPSQFHQDTDRAKSASLRSRFCATSNRRSCQSPYCGATLWYSPCGFKVLIKPTNSGSVLSPRSDAVLYLFSQSHQGSSAGIQSQLY